MSKTYKINVNALLNAAEFEDMLHLESERAKNGGEFNHLLYKLIQLQLAKQENNKSHINDCKNEIICCLFKIDIATISI